MKYKKPEMKIVLFSDIDIITASTLINTEIGGDGGENDNDSLDFNGGFN